MFKDSSLNVLLCYSPFVFGFALVLMAQQLFVQPIWKENDYYTNVEQ